VIERQPLLVNPYEQAVDESLDRVCRRWGARVFPKVRVADVLLIDAPPLLAGRGLTSAERKFALMGHFDFVIADSNSQPQFAVEFDGWHHVSDPKQIARDQKKNSICGKATFPLLRVGSGSLRQVGHWQLLEWLIELWFVARSLEAGEDEDEDELAERRAEYGIRGDDEFDYQTTGRVRLGLNSFSVHDPFADARRAVAEYQWRHRSLWESTWIEGWIEREDGRPTTGFVSLPVGGSRSLLGRGRCALREFGLWVNVLPEKLAQDLAIADLADQLSEYRAGSLDPLTCAEVEALTANAEPMLLTTLPMPSRRQMRHFEFERAVRAGVSPMAALSLAEEDLYEFEDEDD
jgi:hypothetical protein